MSDRNSLQTDLTIKEHSLAHVIKFKGLILIQMWLNTEHIWKLKDSLSVSLSIISSPSFMWASLSDRISSHVAPCTVILIPSSTWRLKCLSLNHSMKILMPIVPACPVLYHVTMSEPIRVVHMMEWSRSLGLGHAPAHSAPARPVSWCEQGRDLGRRCL